MGQDVTRGAFSREDRARYRRKVRRCLDVFALMLNEFRFDSDRPMTGLEIELNLIDPDAQPAMRNAEVLADLADPSFQTELGQFNLEINVAPRVIEGDGLEVSEREVLASLVHADERARKSDARLVLIGILPTLRPEHLVLANMSNDPRYRLLNDQIINARGEDMALDIRGHERLEAQSDSIAGESACTSVQFHLQVAPEDFARHWNASQAIAGIQVAAGANSPFLFGKRLWAETRIALFEQATDTRPEELKAQGVRPRVWFGERWITSIFDLFEENVRYFPPLLPITEEEDPVAVLEAGGVPRLGELRLHNGTIYRWNRPVYDINDGTPHLRVENRVLPAGRPWSTSWPTPPSTSGWSGSCASRTGRSGRRCRSRRPRRTSTSPPARAWTRRSGGPPSARSRSPPCCWTSCCRWPPPASTASACRPRPATGSSASSRAAAAPARTARPGRPGSCSNSRSTGGWTGARHCKKCSSCTPRACTRTSPSTPGRCRAVTGPSIAQ
jgi:hypothetical protein